MTYRVTKRRTAGAAASLIAAALLAVAGAQGADPSHALGTGVPTVQAPVPPTTALIPLDWNNTGSEYGAPPLI